MPTYEYKCPNCGYRFEKFQGMNDDPVRICPHCGKKDVKRLIGAGAGILFKGSGFYATDYRSESYRRAAGADSGSNGKGSFSRTSSRTGKSKKTASVSRSSAKGNGST